MIIERTRIHFKTLMKTKETCQDIFSFSLAENKSWTLYNESLPPAETTEYKDQLRKKYTNNSISSRRKTNTLIIMDSIPSGLRETKMLQRDMIKVRIFPGTKNKDKIFFAILQLKKKQIELVLNVGTNDVLNPSTSDKIFEC